MAITKTASSSESSDVLDNIDVETISSSSVDGSYIDGSDSYGEYISNLDFDLTVTNDYERSATNRAKVLEAGTPKDEYQLDYTSYAVSKFVIQKIKVEVLDGEHSGEQMDVDYVLTADSLNNIVLAPLKKGDTIFLVVTQNEDGTLTGDVSNSWSTVERSNVMYVLGIILLLLLLLYAGKKGFVTSLVAIMILIFGVFLIPNLAFDGINIIAIGIFEVLALIITMSVIHLGVNHNSFKAIVLSCVLTVVAFLILLFGNYITRTVGVTFEFAAIAENVILGNINFEHLYYIISLAISSVFITNTLCMAIKRIEREGAQSYSEKIQLAREVIPHNVIPLMITAVSLYIPNHILLLTNKFSSTEIANAETLISELTRLVATVFCIVIAMPLVSLDCFGFGKKYLKESELDIKETVREKEEDTAVEEEDVEEEAEPEEEAEEIVEEVETKEVEEAEEVSDNKSEEKTETAEKPKKKGKGESK